MYPGELELRRADLYGQRPRAVDCRVIGLYTDRALTYPKEPEAIFYGSANTEAMKRKGTPHRVLDKKTGAVYESIADCMKASGVSKSAIYASIKKGNRFVTASMDARVTGDKMRHNKCTPVIDTKTGVRYESMTLAAEAAGVTIACVSVNSRRWQRV